MAALIPMRPEALVAEVFVEKPEDPEAFGELARRWLAGTVEAFATAQVEELAASPPLLSGNLGRHYGGVGEPGTPWAGLATTAKPGGNEVLHAWSPQAWPRFLKAMNRRPHLASAKFSRLGEYGTPGYGEVQEFSVKDLDRRWLRLTALRVRGEPDPERWEQVAQHWLGFFTTFVAGLEVSPVFGYVSNEVLGDPRTPLEDALRTVTTEDIVDAGQLRGYSWVTVLGPRPAGLVGGTEGLADRGLHRVAMLDNGAVIVQATERLADYEGDAVRRVFEAVAPALPAGLPRKRISSRWRLIYEDAADDRR